MKLTQQRCSIGYVVAVVIALVLIQPFLLGAHPANLAYSDFKILSKDGKVSDLTRGSQTITGTLAPIALDGPPLKDKLDELRRSGKGTPRFTTARVDDPTSPRAHTEVLLLSSERPRTEERATVTRP